MTTSPTFHVRPAGKSPTDAQFFIDAFDSTLPYLASIGSEGMWGLEPFSKREGFAQETTEQVEQSQGLRPTPDGKVLKVLICEAELPDKDHQDDLPEMAYLRTETDSQGSGENRSRQFLSVGAAMVREDWVPSYIEKQEHLGFGKRDAAATTHNARAGFVYLEVMVTDCRPGEYRHGAGAALLRGIKEYVALRGKDTIYVDAWAGNGEKLSR